MDLFFFHLEGDQGHHGDQGTVLEGKEVGLGAGQTTADILVGLYTVSNRNTRVLVLTGMLTSLCPVGVQFPSKFGTDGGPAAR